MAYNETDYKVHRRRYPAANVFATIVAAVGGNTAFQLRAIGIVDLPGLLRASEQTLRAAGLDDWDRSALRRAIAKFTPPMAGNKGA